MPYQKVRSTFLTDTLRNFPFVFDVPCYNDRIRQKGSGRHQ